MKKTTGSLKLTARQLASMKKSVDSGKKTYSEIAEKYGVSIYTVRYHTDFAYKKSEIIRKRKWYHDNKDWYKYQ